VPRAREIFLPIAVVERVAGVAYGCGVQVICGRMEEMAKKATSAADKEKAMAAELSEYKAKWNTDLDVCREALSDLVSTLGEDTANRWRVSSLPEHASGAFEPRDVYNLVCASNEALRRARGGPAGSAPAPAAAARPAKRQRAAEPAAAAAAAPPSNSLRAALASTFEC
jgi:hypothetical protein